MKVKIIKCDFPDRWYADRIGEVFLVEPSYINAHLGLGYRVTKSHYNEAPSVSGTYFIFNGDAVLYEDNSKKPVYLVREEDTNIKWEDYEDALYYAKDCARHSGNKQIIFVSEVLVEATEPVFKVTSLRGK